MLKKLLIGIATVAMLFVGCAGQGNIKPDAELQKIVEVPGFTKQQIHQQAKIWIAENFRSAKSVIEYDNPEDGVLIGNGRTAVPKMWYFSMGQGADDSTCFTMRIDSKDGKFRVTFFNIVLDIGPSYGMYKSPGGERPIRQAEFEKMKPILLNYADRIKDSIIKHTEDKW